MAKPRAYFYQSPNCVCHPATTLKEAAAVLEYDATLCSQNRMRDEARIARHYAKALRAVADGRTWADVLEFGPMPERRSTEPPPSV